MMTFIEVSVVATDDETHEIGPPLIDSRFESQFTLILSQQLPFPVTLDLEYSGTATRDLDYRSEINGVVDTTLIVPANTDSMAIDLTTLLTDEIVEGTETIILEIANSGGLQPVIPSSDPSSLRDTIFIFDDDAAILGSTNTIAGINEGDTNQLSFVVDKQCSNPIIIQLEYSGRRTAGNRLHPVRINGADDSSVQHQRLN